MAGGTCRASYCSRFGKPLKSIGVVTDDEGHRAKVWECPECGYFENKWVCHGGH